VAAGARSGRLSARLAHNLYITAMDPESGKSLVALGIMELLSTRVPRVGFFRPIVASGDQLDPQIELARRRYQLAASYADMHALADDEAQEAIAAGDYDEVSKRVVSAYRQLESRCDAVVCEGTDFTGATPSLDFDLNASLANQLGCPVLVVVRGSSVPEIGAAVRVATESLDRKRCSLFGVIVNRVPPALVGEVGEAVGAGSNNAPVYVLAEQPELEYPTIGEVTAALGARPLFDPGEGMQRDVRAVRVAAMSVGHFIDDLIDGTLVIVPGDRSDILVASLASTLSPDLPAVAGLVLTAGYEVTPSVRRMLARAPFPVLEVPDRTYVTATAVHRVRARITADQPRKIATALGVFESAVDAAELERRIRLERPPRKTPVMFEYELIELAKQRRQHIVLPEGGDERILRAADILLRRDVVDLTILGDADATHARSAALDLDLSAAELVDPLRSPLRDTYAQRYHQLRERKGVNAEIAFDALGDVNYFGTLMVHTGDADGMVSGAMHTTGQTIRPALEVVRARKGVSIVSSVFFMCLADRVLVYGDCAVNPQPDSRQLADIAISSADTAAVFGIDPRVAMLSFSTGQSGAGENVDMVRDATAFVRERRPELPVEGPIQYDAAVDASVAKIKLPGSEVAGQATIFIFPDLDTGNIAYKAVQRSANALAVGPVLQGLARPVNDLSRGCGVADIVNTVAITAVQAQTA
jgi:phosphate acetyltransferase